MLVSVGSIIKHKSIVLFRALGFIAVCGVLSGCVMQMIEEFEDTPISDLFVGPKVNVTEQNYAAADYLVGQVQTFISKRNDFIKVTELVDVDEPALHSAVGKSVPMQIGSRFSQLGYAVDLSDVADGAEAEFLKNAPAYQNTQPDFLIAGNLRRLTKEVEIRLRVVEADTGRVISSYGYVLPFSTAVRKDATPEARIIRMEK